MRTLIVLLATATASTVLAMPTDPADEVSRVTAPAPPLSGTCTSTFDPPPMPLPPVIVQVDHGTCRLSHLGRATFYDEHEINFATGVSTSIDMYFTAANGDILRATSTGTFQPNGSGVDITAVVTFAGGTGRFTKATGAAIIEGQADFTTNSTTFTIDGTISY